MSKEHAGGTPKVAIQSIEISPFEEDRFPVPIQDFDWSQVEPDREEEFKSQVLHATKDVLYKLLAWIHADGEGKPQGVMIRSYIVAWGILPYLQNISQTDLARLMGLKHKQSVGRHVSEFRDRFPLLNNFLHSEAAREKCRQREKRKRAAELEQQHSASDFEI